MELAVNLYADRRLSHAQALRLSGLTRSEFQTQLARHDIALDTVENSTRT